MTTALQHVETLEVRAPEIDRCKKRKRRRKTPSPVMVERHWKKVLQANGTPCASGHGSRHCRCDNGSCPNKTPKGSPNSSEGFFSSLVHRFLSWKRQPRYSAAMSSPLLTSEESDGCVSEDSFHCGFHSESGYDYFLRHHDLEVSQTSPMPRRRIFRSMSLGAGPLSAAPHTSQPILKPGQFQPPRLRPSNGSTTSNMRALPLPAIEVTETDRVFSPATSTEDLQAFDGHVMLQARRDALSRTSSIDFSQAEDGLSQLELCRKISAEEDTRSIHSEKEADLVIPLTDIDLGESFRRSKQCDIYRANWYGPVVVHMYKNGAHEGVFWKNVEKLCRIRHESIALFAGACVEPSHLAIVTCIPVSSESLYVHIHCQQEKRTVDTPVNLLRQVAQSIGYLHARGIVLGNLSSRNIFLCPTAKLSVMDFGFTDVKHYREDCAVLQRGQLTYLAPELLRTSLVVPPDLCPQEPCTAKTDTFAFGTLMCEVLYGSYPFAGEPAHTIIWQVCNGLFLAEAATSIRELRAVMESCWRVDPGRRPSFTDITKDLTETVIVHRSVIKRQSSSEPDGLNRFGF